MDTIGWFIANLHQMLGHDKTATVIGMPAGDRAACVICQYEAHPDKDTRAAVIRALAAEGTADDA